MDINILVSVSIYFIIRKLILFVNINIV